jgi:hypothetical protein
MLRYKTVKKAQQKSRESVVVQTFNSIAPPKGFGAQEASLCDKARVQLLLLFQSEYVVRKSAQMT